MGKHIRHVDGVAIFCAKFDAELLQIGGGLRTHIDNDIPNRSANASDEFSFGRRGNLVMHSANRSPGVAVGDVCLHKPRFKSVLGEFLYAKSSREKAAVVFFLVQLDDERSAKSGFVEDHRYL